MRAALLLLVGAVLRHDTAPKDKPSSLLRVEDQAAVVGPRRAAFLAAQRAGKQPVEQLVAYQNRSLGLPMAAAVSKVTSAEWKAELDKVLAAGPSRFILAPQIAQVKDALKADLKAKTQSIEQEGFDVHYMGTTSTAFNIVGRIQGEDANKFVLVGAHYDSIPTTGPAPGAEDNGSGVATLMSIAKKLQSLGKPKYSVEFVLFSAEEEGLLGSKAYVKHLEEKDRKKYFRQGVILDEVSFTRTADHKLIFETSGNSDPNNVVVDTLAGAAKAAAPDVTYEVNYHGFGSDHMSFLEHGMPAVLVIERDNMYFAETYGHSPRDTAARTSPDFGAKVASLVAQAVSNCAGFPGASKSA